MVYTVHIVGLGAGNLDQLSIGAWNCLQSGKAIYFRTKEHPVVRVLEEQGICYESFDAVYEKNAQFSSVYDEIVMRLLALATSEDIVYGVPGHPMIAEKTTEKLLKAQDEGKIHVKIYSAPSFLDEMFTSLKIDPVDGFVLLDATGFSLDELQFRKHMIFTQVYDTNVASEVKLALLEGLPHDYPVTLLSKAGMPEETLQVVCLCELDHGLQVDNLRSIYVPPVKKEDLLPNHDFSTLLHIIETLRGPEGCPWDQKQTHESLKKYLKEESEELFEAIDLQDAFMIEEELGDVLLQVVLHAQIAKENNNFSIFDVIRTLNEKMIRRHPHVFGNTKAETVEEVMQIWKEIKEKE